MAQIQGYDKTEKIEKLDAYILGISSVYMMRIISDFSSDTSAVSRGKSAVIARFLERTTRKITAGLFSYDIGELVEKLIVIVRKAAHLFEFFLLASLIFAFVEKLTRKTRPLFAALITTLYAAFDELHQAFVPGRGPMLSDVAIDSLGAFLAVVVLYHFFKGNKYNI